MLPVGWKRRSLWKLAKTSGNPVDNPCPVVGKKFRCTISAFSRAACEGCAMAEQPDQPESFECPRCASVVLGQEIYGPCEGCVAELRASYSGEGREVVAPEYEPKMNVTPNAVALKD